MILYQIKLKQIISCSKIKIQLKLIDYMLQPDKCRLYSMTEDEMKDKNSPKSIDEPLIGKKVTVAVFPLRLLLNILIPISIFFIYS